MISIIVPTLNEARNLGRLLARLADEETAHEVIVADGGSDDGSGAIAEDKGARLIAAPRGRGGQLVAGARLAQGGVLLFLHADCDFPAGGLAAIEKALEAAPETVGGNFRLLFDGEDAFCRWLDRFYAWIRRKGLYYGDSGIFVRAEVYQALGGIRPIALMEDYDFTRRMERAGPTACIAEPPLVTSARRFRGRPALAIVAGWLAIHALFHLGVGPERLARLYRSERA